MVIIITTSLAFIVTRLFKINHLIQIIIKLSLVNKTYKMMR